MRSYIYIWAPRESRVDLKCPADWRVYRRDFSLKAFILFGSQCTVSTDSVRWGIRVG